VDIATERTVKPWLKEDPILRPIYQIHINKTGGTTAGQALGLKFRHVDANDLRLELGPDAFEQAFIFSFVRNPWDRIVSHFHWRIKTNQTGLGDNPIPFQDWVTACFDQRDPKYYDKPRMFRQQTEWLRGGSDHPVHPAIDFIGRFETLTDDIKTLAHKLNRPLEDGIPHLKPSNRKRDYRSYYGDRTAAIIARAFHTDIQTFGYEFDPNFGEN